jgi:hypothetical protein
MLLVGCTADPEKTKPNKNEDENKISRNFSPIYFSD